MGYKKAYGLDENYAEENCASDSGAKKSKKRYTITRKGIAIFTAFCLMFSGCVGFGGAMVASSISNDASANPATGIVTGTNYDLATATGSELSIQEIIALAANSVVEISTEQVVNDTWMG